MGETNSRPLVSANAEVWFWFQKECSLNHDPSYLRPPGVAALMFSAADVIEQRGLAKRVLCDPAGAVCLYGAVRIAAGYRPGHFFPGGDGFPEVTAALNKYLGIKGLCGNTAWNNAPERTAAEVAAALRGAAKLS